MRLGLSAGRSIPTWSRLSRFTLWQRNDVSSVFPTHRGINRAADGLDRAPQRVRVQMRVAMRGGCLRMAQQLSDDRQAHGRARADAGEAVPQIVEAHAVEPSGLAYSGPRLFQIGTRRAS
jgi:hypothetical protein